MSAHVETASPVGGPIMTRAFRILIAIFVVGLVLTGWRFVVGLGPATALNDGYAWGLWKIVNVIVLTALASGGYATALLVYVLNRQIYHPLIRTAILTSAVGYTSGVIALGVDIGRPWNFWRIAIVTGWNLHSVLLEVAVCISTYIIFLWLEVAPAFLEVAKESRVGFIARTGKTWLPRLERVAPWILAAAVVLPTMHQSSLGSLFLLSGPRIHPLWQTPMIPLLFLLSCWILGYAAVALVSMLSGLVWKRPIETPLLGRMSRTMSFVIFAFLFVRIADVLVRGQLANAFAFDPFSLLFLAELVLFAVPAVAMLSPKRQKNAGSVFRMALVTATAGALYRLDTSLIAFLPGQEWSYFPSVPELIIAAGWVSLGVLGYIFIVKRFPILSRASDPARAAAASQVR